MPKEIPTIRRTITAENAWEDTLKHIKKKAFKRAYVPRSLTGRIEVTTDLTIIIHKNTKWKSSSRTLYRK